MSSNSWGTVTKSNYEERCLDNQKYKMHRLHLG